MKMLKKILIGFVVVFYLSFATFMTAIVFNYNDFGQAEFDGKTMFMIKEELANEKFKKGDLVFTEKKIKNNYKIGDDIFVYRVDDQKKVHVTIGKLSDIEPIKGSIQIENGGYYSKEYVAGTVYKIYPNIGNFLSIILNKTGFLLIIIVPIFFIFTAQIYALVIEIKYGDDDSSKRKKDDEDDDEDEEKPKKVKKVIVEKEEVKEKKLEKEEKEEVKEDKSINDLADDFLND